MSNLIKTDTSYRQWIEEISIRFKQSQIKAAVKVNDEMLRFYWSLGKDISDRSKNANYGSNFYQALSSDLREIFPKVHSFSVTNLKYMKYFYEMYPDEQNNQNRPQLVDSFKEAIF